MEQVIVIDLGGTKIAGALADRDGRLTETRRVLTPSRQGAAGVVAEIVRLVRDLDAQAGMCGITVRGIGIGSAGVVDRAGRNIIAATDAIKGWAGTPVADLIEAETGLPVTLENDVNAHLRGEAWKGVGQGKRQLAMMALGTGIGGAVMIDGEIVVGPRGTVGDFGHLPTFLPTKRACSCGRNTPHLEAVASGPGLQEWYLEKGGDCSISGVKELEKKAQAGDDLALETYQEVGRETGRALGSIVNILDPEIMIVGGGLANSSEIWWQPLRAAYQEQLVEVLCNVPVVKAQLGNQAALVGAAKKIWDFLDSQHQFIQERKVRQ